MSQQLHKLVVRALLDIERCIWTREDQITQIEQSVDNLPTLREELAEFQRLLEVLTPFKPDDDEVVVDEEAE